MARIFGKDGYGRLLLGREFNINDIKTRTFTVAATETNGVEAGDLVVYGTTTQVYKLPAATTDKVAGIVLGTNVKLDNQFPESASEVKFKAGDSAACVIQGDVAVKLNGTAPTEGAAVYYDLTNKAFTTASTSNLACANMEFRGITEGNLTVVRVRY